MSTLQIDELSCKPDRAENAGTVEANMDIETGDTIDATTPSGVVDAATSLAQESTPISVVPSADREGNAEEPGASEGMHVNVNLVDPATKSTKNSSLDFHPRLGSRGRARQLCEEKMHHIMLPSTGQKHAVPLFWPRDDGGKPITQSNKHWGKRTPDDYPWGATRHDFFQVKTAPANDLKETSVMTSSQLLRTMKDFGELRKARYEIEWAKSEGEPKVQNVASTQDLIETFEKEVNRSRTDLSGDSAARDTTSSDGLDIPITSPFHPSHYPSPWPSIPFERTQVLLQERIPSYLLPQILYVHDPYNVLSAVEPTSYGYYAWTSKPDVSHTYTLDLREATLTEVEREREKAEELEELKAHTSIILRYTQTIEQTQDHEPIIEVKLPPYPRRLTKVEEGHLYLSPAGKTGTGNHSVVYHAEWELPRDLLVRPKICTPCLRESTEKEIERLKTTGEWDSILRPSGASEGTAGAPQTGDGSDKMDEVGNPPTTSICEQDGEILKREIVCVVSPDVPPMDVLGMIDASGIWNDLMRHREKTSVLLRLAEGDEVNATESRSASIIRINPTVTYSNPSLPLPHTLCSHDPASPVPRTAKFKVIAKLSIEGDTHLKAEARNYQKFPNHFFEHWSGYTFLKRLNRIVPLSAIVPQFYGFYTPRDEGAHGGERVSATKNYLSPILLIEHCGMHIGTTSLSVEEQEECASLFVRFHHGGWLHESVYPRNVLVQKRRPTNFPLKGTWSRDLNFRLIDFGRSKEFKEASDREEEERDMRQLFKYIQAPVPVPAPAPAPAPAPIPIPAPDITCTSHKPLLVPVIPTHQICHRGGAPYTGVGFGPR